MSAEKQPPQARRLIEFAVEEFEVYPAPDGRLYGARRGEPHRIPAQFALDLGIHPVTDAELLPKILGWTSGGGGLPRLFPWRAQGDSVNFPSRPGKELVVDGACEGSVGGRGSFPTTPAARSRRRRRWRSTGGAAFGMPVREARAAGRRVGAGQGRRPACPGRDNDGARY